MIETRLALVEGLVAGQIGETAQPEQRVAKLVDHMPERTGVLVEDRLDAQDPGVPLLAAAKSDTVTATCVTAGTVAEMATVFLLGAVAYPLPVTVIAELLGLPAGDRELFRTWADKLLTLDVEDPNDPTLADKLDEATAELLAYLHEHCADRRAHPGEDLISRLATTEADGQRLTDEEVVNFSFVLLLAGHITTTALLGNAMLCLDANPQGWTQMQEGPTNVSSPIQTASTSTAAPPEFYGRGIFAARNIPVDLRPR